MLMLTSTHRALMAAKNAEIALLKAERTIAWEAADDTRDKHDSFVAEIAALSAKALTPPEKATPIVQPVDPVSQAVTRKAGGNRALRDHLYRFAAEQRSLGVDDAAIVRRVLDWSQPETVEDDELARAESDARLADLLG